MRFTTRRMMIAVAVLAVPLAFAAFVERELRRMFPSTPAEWARREAVSPWTADTVEHYRELAKEFERSGEAWAEETYDRPYSDILPAGQALLIRPAVKAEPTNAEGKRRRDRRHWSILRGTSAAVTKDWAGDADGCDPLRDILVKFLDGPHQGQEAYVPRAFMRRKP
jgi:hypothetical protein